MRKYQCFAKKESDTDTLFVLKEQSAALKRQIDFFEEETIALYEEFASEVCDVKTYKAKKENLIRSQNETRLEYKLILDRIQEKIYISEKDINGLKEMSRCKEITSLTPELVNELVDNITVYPMEKLG